MRIKMLAPRVSALAPKVTYLGSDPAEASRARDARRDWRAWYKTARWQRLRWSVLVAAGFRCAICGRTRPGPEMVADHKEPHRGNAGLFWDRGNLQALCKPCHDGVKQIEERRR